MSAENLDLGPAYAPYDLDDGTLLDPPVGHPLHPAELANSPENWPVGADADADAELPGGVS